MSTYDIIMLVVFAVTVFFGYQKGLARQIASVLSIVIGYFVAMNFREPLAKTIPAEAPWNKIAAMAILFLAASLLVWAIYAQVSSSLKKMELKGFDHQAGAILGGIKGLLLCCIITMFSVSLLGQRAHRAIHDSKSGNFVVSTIYKLGELLPIVPPEIRNYLDPQFRRFDEAYSGTSSGRFQYPTSEGGSQNPFSIPKFEGKWNVPGSDSKGSSAGFQLPPIFPGQGRNGNGGQSNGQTNDFISDIKDAAIQAGADKAREWLEGGNTSNGNRNR